MWWVNVLASLKYYDRLIWDSVLHLFCDMSEYQIGRLGKGGSDFTSFLHHVGVLAINIHYGKGWEYVFKFIFQAFSIISLVQ